MTSYEVSIGFWAIGYTFHAFYGPFRCLSSRELLSTIPEDRMTHFVTLTISLPRTDHSLRHGTIRVGLRAIQFRILWLHKKRLFRAIFVAIAHDFRHPGQIFRNLPDFYQILVDDILWGFHWIMSHRVHVPCLLRVVSLPFQPRITVNHSGGQNDSFRHSNGPSSTYRP
jgi:hypothetical protein